RTLVVVDVLSFGTCVSIGVERGGTIYPFDPTDDSATAFARSRRARLAGRRGDEFSLSPASLLSLPANARLVLPSPNGAAIALRAAGGQAGLAGCFRNRPAVAARAIRIGGPFGVVAAGERWNDGSLRPALEDLLGAGAVIAMLPGGRSPEAEGAAAAF